MKKHTKYVYTCCLLAAIAGCSNSNNDGSSQTDVDNTMDVDGNGNGNGNGNGSTGISVAQIATAVRNSQPATFDATTLQAELDAIQSIEPVPVADGDTVLDLLEKAQR